MATAITPEVFVALRENPGQGAAVLAVLEAQKKVAAMSEALDNAAEYLLDEDEEVREQGLDAIASFRRNCTGGGSIVREFFTNYHPHRLRERKNGEDSEVSEDDLQAAADALSDEN